VHPSHPGKNGAPVEKDITLRHQAANLRTHTSLPFSHARKEKKQSRFFAFLSAHSQDPSNSSYCPDYSLSTHKNSAGQCTLIRALDIIFAIIGIVLALPIFVFVPLLIKLDSEGPVFYKQIRAGIDRRHRNRRGGSQKPAIERRRQERRRGNLFGKPFHIYKFRTMEKNAERKSGPIWAMQDDPRITSFGKRLRQYHLDEIPQLINVLKGDMGLVGPRPERPAIISGLIRHVPQYSIRLLARPGVTGLAQICRGYDECLEDVKQKVRLDRFYISNSGIRLWLKVLFYTAIKVFGTANIDEDSFLNGHPPRKEKYNYEASHHSMLE